MACRHFSQKSDVALVVYGSGEDDGDLVAIDTSESPVISGRIAPGNGCSRRHDRRPHE